MSEIERLTLLMLLQIYGCGTASRDDDGRLPRDICDENNFEKEVRMLKQRNSRQKLNNILSESIDTLNRVGGNTDCEQNTHNYNGLVETDEKIDGDVKRNIVYVAKMMHNLNFIKQDTDSSDETIT